MNDKSAVTRLPHSSLVIASIFALAVSGCAPLPALDKNASVKSIAQYETQESLGGKLADGKRGVWPQDAWWRVYGDPQLDALIAEGLKDSPTMTIAEARLRRAMAFTEVADSASQPQLNATVNPTVQKQSYHYLTPKSSLPHGTHGYGLAALNFSWEIDFWGKNRAALAAATSQQKASAADVSQARLTLAASIATAYGELARLYVLHDNAQSAVNVRSQTAALMKQRHEHGMELLANVKQSDGRKASGEEEVLALEVQIAQQRHRIAALLGAGPDRGLKIARPTIDLAKKFILPAQLQLELLGRRPDIVAARLRAEAMDHTVDKQRAEFYPNVNLAAMVGYQSLGLDNLTKSGSAMGSVGPAITLPILTGGRLQGLLRSAQAEQDEAIGTYNSAVAQALQEVADAAITQKSLTQQIEKLQQATDAASEAYRIMRNRYQGGLASYLDVLSAEEALLGSQRVLRDMQSRAFMIDVALIKALGGGYQDPDKALIDKGKQK